MFITLFFQLQNPNMKVERAFCGVNLEMTLRHDGQYKQQVGSLQNQARQLFLAN